MVTKWGILGAGKISHDFVTSVRSVPDNDRNHVFVSIAARDITDAQKFAAMHKIPNAYGSYEELARDADVEVVYIGTIHPYHLSAAKLMTENGKHVIVEKPLTLNAKCSAQLIQSAKDNHVFCMEALWSRFLPSYEFVMEQLRSNVIGHVYHVNVTFGKPMSGVPRIARKDLGGGTLLDIGIYAINIVIMAFNGEKPQKIAAVGHLNDDGVDESVSAAMTFTGGKTASIATHSRVQLPCEAHIVGSDGIIKLPNPFWAANKVYVNDTLYEFPFSDTIYPCNFGNSSGLRYEADEVRRCITSGKLESDRMKHDDSLLMANIMDEIRTQIGVKYDVD